MMQCNHVVVIKHWGQDCVWDMQSQQTTRNNFMSNQWFFFDENTDYSEYIASLKIDIL